MKQIITVMILSLIITFNTGINYPSTANETAVSNTTEELTLRTHEEQRQYERFTIRTLTQPVKLEDTQNGVEGLIDISRGGVALKHNNTLKEGDIIPLHITYKDITVHTQVQVTNATETRAGAKYINHSQSLTNKLLYLSIMLEADNNMLKTKLST